MYSIAVQLQAAGRTVEVMTEHVETWVWPTGETLPLPVLSVHEVRDGTIVRWTDYWDMAALVNAAPAWWFEHVMQGWK